MMEVNEKCETIYQFNKDKIMMKFMGKSAGNKEIILKIRILKVMKLKHIRL